MSQMLGFQYISWSPRFKLSNAPSKALLYSKLVVLGVGVVCAVPSVLYAIIGYLS